MPIEGWDAFSSALQDLAGLSSGGSGSFGGSGGSSDGGPDAARAAGLPVGFVDPTDEAYLIPRIEDLGGHVSPSGSIDWGPGASVNVEGMSGPAVDRLLDAGWTGDPHDHEERLYAPD